VQLPMSLCCNGGTDPGTNGGTDPGTLAPPAALLVRRILRCAAHGRAGQSTRKRRGARGRRHAAVGHHGLQRQLRRDPGLVSCEGYIPSYAAVSAYHQNGSLPTDSRELAAGSYRSDVSAFIENVTGRCAVGCAPAI
jgi:hypothetical protein